MTGALVGRVDLFLINPGRSFSLELCCQSSERVDIRKEGKKNKKPKKKCPEFTPGTLGIGSNVRHFSPSGRADPKDKVTKTLTEYEGDDDVHSAPPSSALIVSRPLLSLYFFKPFRRWQSGNKSSDSIDRRFVPFNASGRIVDERTRAPRLYIYLMRNPSVCHQEC